MTILPMSFCYPGRGKAGDNPPVKACAPLWHKKLLAVTKPKLTLLVGKHAQDYYLADTLSLTQKIAKLANLPATTPCFTSPIPTE